MDEIEFPEEVRELVRRYLPMRINGSDLSDLRQSMENQQVDPILIKLAIRRIDDLYLEEIKRKNQRAKHLENCLLGLALFVIGLVISGMSWFGAIGSRYVIFFIGPIFYGGYLAYNSWNSYKELEEI